MCTILLARHSFPDSAKREWLDQEIGVTTMTSLGCYETSSLGNSVFRAHTFGIEVCPESLISFCWCAGCWQIFIEGKNFVLSAE